MDPAATTFQAIGVIHTPFGEVVGTPIQGAFAPQSEGLADVEQFSHLYLVYAFHRRQRMALTCVPFLDDVQRGVFATRAPCRPNALGLSVVRLLRREGSCLHVAGVDMLDGTPLLDIKPYVPAFDVRSEATSGWITDTTRPPATEGADGRFEE